MIPTARFFNFSLTTSNRINIFCYFRNNSPYLDSVQLYNSPYIPKTKQPGEPMQIDTLDVVIGAVIASALWIIFSRLYYGIFGGKEMRRLKKENREMKKALDEKDKYIRKSLEELKNEAHTRSGNQEDI